MKKLHPYQIDDTFEEVTYNSFSEYQKQKGTNLPQYYTSEKIKEGKREGFDRIRYFKKALFILIIVFLNFVRYKVAN